MEAIAHQNRHGLRTGIYAERFPSPAPKIQSAFNGFFDVQSYMSIPRFLRPNGAIQLPSFPGIDYQAKRKAHKIMNQIGWLTVCYEEKIKSIERA